MAAAAPQLAEDADDLEPEILRIIEALAAAAVAEDYARAEKASNTLQEQAA